MSSHYQQQQSVLRARERPKASAPEVSPAEKLRRHAIGMLRELARQYPSEYAQIGRELALGGVK